MAKSESKIKPLQLALIGGETLLGRELQDVLEKRSDAPVITGYASTAEGNFAEQEGEAIYLAPLEAKSASGYDAILLAGSTPNGALKAYQLAKAAQGHPLLIDCVGHLEQQPEARIVSPVNEAHWEKSWLQTVAHPAAGALALVLTKLAAYAGLKQTIANIFEPASERGKPGISELHQQTTSLLAFKTLEKKVFDSQLSFNLLPQYGEDAPTKLSTVEQRIEHHLASILNKQEQPALVHMPSLRVVQAPVFHGYGISLWVEFETSVSADEVRAALKCPEIEVRGEQDEPPDNVGATSQSGLIAGDIRVDRNNSRAVWIWIVGDNLRLTADAASEIVDGLKRVSK
ncbi:MAG: hypothetical protein M3Y57_22550 [Acidobacteriota bacterium]|nr:hypothetical protein [Acidobacteriota bacterium]